MTIQGVRDYTPQLPIQIKKSEHFVTYSDPAYSNNEANQQAMPVVVSIAGSDPSAGAGIQADLKTFAALGVYGMSIISMLTAQNFRTVSAIEAVSPTMFEAQFRSVFDAYPIAAIKIGMVGDVRIIGQLTRLLEEYRPAHVVLDPVLRSTSGGTLSSTECSPLALFAPLLPWVELLTPNIPEAAALLGRPQPTQLLESEALLTELSELGCRAVLLKGGHDSDPHYCHDLLRLDNETHEFRHARINSSHLHGTGCTLSSAITGFLAKGEPLNEAVVRAIAFTQMAIQSADRIGIAPVNGPLNHFNL